MLPSDPSPGALPLDPHWGLCSQPPIYARAPALAMAGAQAPPNVISWPHPWSYTLLLYQWGEIWHSCQYNVGGVSLPLNPLIWDYCQWPGINYHLHTTAMHVTKSLDTRSCHIGSKNQLSHTRPFYSSLDHEQDNPGELVPEGHFAIFWIFWCKMKITQADAPTIWMDCHPIQTNWCPPLCHPHHFYAGCLPDTTLPTYPGLGQAPNMLAYTKIQLNIPIHEPTLTANICGMASGCVGSWWAIVLAHVSGPYVYNCINKWQNSLQCINLVSSFCQI